MTTKNRGTCFLNEPPKIKTRRYTELAVSAPIKSLIDKSDGKLNGIRNWRTQKLTFRAVNKIENMKIERTPEILKPCWLQKKGLNTGLKKCVRFDLPHIDKDTISKKIVELPPPPPIILKSPKMDLTKSILSWKPHWIKTNNPHFQETFEETSFFRSTDEYKKCDFNAG